MPNNPDQAASDAQDTTYSNIDHRVDRYVRKEMTDEEEMIFESEFLADSEVLTKIEQTYMLLDGLKANAEPLPPKKSKKLRWFAPLRYLVVPQTAIGAALASLIIVIMTAEITPKAPHKITGSHVQHIRLENYRKGDTDKKDKDPINVTRKNQEDSLIIGFDFNTGLALIKPYTLTILDNNKDVIWSQKNLWPDPKSTLYIDISHIPDGYYESILHDEPILHYKSLTEEEKDKTKHAKFTIRGQK